MAKPDYIDFFADNHNGLSPNEIIFCTAYASNGQNATKAYLKAYPEVEDRLSAGKMAHILLKKLEVKKLINNKLNDRLACADLDMDWVQARLKNIANANIQDHVHPETGKNIAIKDLPRHIAANVKELEVSIVGDMRFEKTKLHSAQKALDTLGNMFKPEVQRHEITGKDGKPIGIEHSGGVLAIPVMTCAETWAKDAKESQEAVHKIANEE